MDEGSAVKACPSADSVLLPDSTYPDREGDAEDRLQSKVNPFLQLREGFCLEPHQSKVAKAKKLLPSLAPKASELKLKASEFKVSELKVSALKVSAP